MLLHTVSNSSDIRALNDCLQLCVAGDTVLCLGDAVYALQLSLMPSGTIPLGVETKVLGSDLACRGMDAKELIPGIVVCPDDALTFLSLQADKVIHWG